MLKQKTKDIEVGGKKYRLTKLDARTGSYIAAKLAILAAPMLAQGKAVDAASVSAAMPNLKREDFDELQTLLLQRVQKLNDVQGQLLPEPVLKADGAFVDEELAYNVANVMNLTVQSIMFNVGDFFAEAGFQSPAQ